MCLLRVFVKNPWKIQPYVIIFNRFVASGWGSKDEKKLRWNRLKGPKRSLKRPCNHPLSTGHHN
jgi:hypothetical protein